METSYRDFKVSYQEFNDTWKGLSSEGIEIFCPDGLAGLKKKVDKHISDECKSQNITVLTSERYNSRSQIEVATITSVAEDGDIWIRRTDKSREKLSKFTAIYTDSEPNKKIVQAIETIHDEIKVKKEEEKGLMESLEIYNKDNS